MKNTQRNNPNKASDFLRVEMRSPYLLWLIWVVWTPLIIPSFVIFFQAQPTLLRLIATLVGAALFFAIYLRASWRRAQGLASVPSLPEHTDASTWLTIIVLAALSFTVALLGRGSGWQGLFYYTGGYVGGSLMVRRAALVGFALTLVAVAAGWLSGLGWLDILQSFIFITAIIFITKSVMWSITTSWELHSARKEIARLAVMTERLRIARDLHDLLGHNLSLIALKSELAGRLIKVAPERAATEIGDVENVARTTLQEVREAVASYRQPTLANELHAAQEILGAAGIAYRYEGDENVIGALPSVIEAALSWVVREGVTNVIRHSRARQCIIRVTRDNDNARIEITDDGVGIAFASIIDNRGNGLRGLAERVEALDGHCETGRDIAGGFRIAVSVPLAQRNHQAGITDPSAASAASDIVQTGQTIQAVSTNGSGKRSKQL